MKALTQSLARCKTSVFLKQFGHRIAPSDDPSGADCKLYRLSLSGRVLAILKPQPALVLNRLPLAPHCCNARRNKLCTRRCLPGRPSLLSPWKILRCAAASQSFRCRHLFNLPPRSNGAPPGESGDGKIALMKLMASRPAPKFPSDES